jgi:hypothetical protein
MKMPTTKTGNLAVGLMGVCVLDLAVFFLFMAAGVVDFDTGHAWDIAVAVASATGLAAFVLGLVSWRKDPVFLVRGAVVLSFLGLLFLLTHSLFIND